MMRNLKTPMLSAKPHGLWKKYLEGRPYDA